MPPEKKGKALPKDVLNHVALNASCYEVSPVACGLVAETNWAETPLGSPATWPLELRAMVDVVLASRFPMVFWWGRDLIQMYNDAYLPIIGGKHPKAFGQTARDCWAEIWDKIGPLINSVQSGGRATWSQDVLLDINRHGYVGESYFTWSYSPLPCPLEPNNVGGVLCTVQETTEKVIGERRILLLRDLAAFGAEVKDAEEECRLATATIGRYARSVPFAAIYLTDESQHFARLTSSYGVDAGDTQAFPPTIDVSGGITGPWPCVEALRTGSLVRVEHLDHIIDRVPKGPWPEPPREAVVVPIASGIGHESAGFLVAGVNPREAFDERYRSFYELIAGQIAAAISSTRAYEHERKRAESLAELDRAKIEFFSNISHEFRTPLTLMLGPLAQLLREADEAQKPVLETAHRNALRLLKLVNTLLEFSRLEAGRSDATFVASDLTSSTRELCGLFASAVESAHLRFPVDIDLDQHVYVDRAMWDTIVLNLLSNALKFTHAGEIALTLRANDGFAELSVRDTGIGIPEADLPFVFERFRRVRGAKSRTHEGSGIGLALVDELVRLHGGSIKPASEVGKGTTFTVRIPLGRDHLDPESIVDAAPPVAYASVVEQYLADVESTFVRTEHITPRTDGGRKATRVLLVDDNADLRAYVSRILAPQHGVVAVGNGVEALRELREGHFDIVVSDVMMPEMDGFALVRAIRDDPALATIPFVMLSARAGEGAAIEGLTRGADDYLAKPFASEELLARVYAQLSAVAIRERATQELRESEERFRTLAASMPHIVLEADPDRGVTFLSRAFATYTGLAAEAGYGTGWIDAVHPEDFAATADVWTSAIASGTEFACEFRLRRADGVYRWHMGRAMVRRDHKAGRDLLTGTITDIHDMRRSVQEREFLSEASEILARSLDLDTTLQSLATITIPLFADWCQIDLRTEDGRIRTVAIAHRDPMKNTLAQQFVGQVHLNPAAERGIPYTIRTGKADLVEDTRPVAAVAIDDDGELAVYQKLGMHSALIVPLVAEGKTLGSVAATYGESARQFTPDDIPMLEELGRRAGVAVQRASEFEREHRVAQSFQEASLPSALPTLGGATFDAVYVPASEEAQVGGDWYDAVRLVDGRVVVSIGDVAGHGLRAAVMMGNMRQIIRGIAQVHADPALMLDAADRALRLEYPDRFATAFVGVYDPVVGSFAYASAGHPPPMLRHPGGAVELLSDGGLPLGLRHLVRESGKTVQIRPGSHLVLYTDGLTEWAQRPADGEDRLRGLLAEGAILSGAHPAQALRHAIFGDAAAKDDVAILVFGVAEQAAVPMPDQAMPVERWFFDAGDAIAAQAARRAFTTQLRARAADDRSIQRAEVIFGELVGNAARYAPGAIEVTVDWSAASPVLHVLDNGPGFHHVPALPSDVYAESGRGLFIISSLSEDFSVAKRPERGSHARAVLSMRRRVARRA